MLRKNQAKIKKDKAYELFDEGLVYSAVAERLGIGLTTCQSWFRKWKLNNNVTKKRRTNK